MADYSIALIPGDTVGPELIRQAVKIFHALSACSEHFFHLEILTACGPGIEAFGCPLPSASLKKALRCQAVLLGNIGFRRYQSLPPSKRPEQALLQLRGAFRVCANLRPLKIYPGLACLSPLKESYLTNGMDLVVVRDLQGGMFSPAHPTTIKNEGKSAGDLEYYSEDMVRFTAKIAFHLARHRNKRVASLDKSNVLASSLLWRKTITEYARSFPDISLTHQYIDNASMEVIRNPGAFDVIVTSNVFGDILSDELTQLTGAPCLFGSAELAADKRGLYTPNQLHHSCEEIAGKNIVHPLGILDAIRLLLMYSCSRPDLSALPSHVAASVIKDRLTTPELPIPGFADISTDEMGDEIANRLLRSSQNEYP